MRFVKTSEKTRFSWRDKGRRERELEAWKRKTKRGALTTIDGPRLVKH